MAGFLSVSRAAKVVGVSRTEIQDKIRSGILTTFEGQVSFDNLQSAYPAVCLENNTDVDRMRRIQASAIDKNMINSMTDEKVLRMEIYRLRRDLDSTTEQLHLYKRVTSELRNRLMGMQESCTQRQKLMLRALLGWMSVQIQQGKK